MCSCGAVTAEPISRRGIPPGNGRGIPGSEILDGMKQQTAKNPCGACGGRGWKWVSARRYLLFRPSDAGLWPDRRRVRCERCVSTDRAEVA